MLCGSTRVAVLPLSLLALALISQVVPVVLTNNKKSVKKGRLVVDRSIISWHTTGRYGNLHTRRKKLKKLMLLASMVAMVLVAAAPAFAQQAATGGNSAVEGGTVTAEDSIVAQCNNLFNVSGNVVQQEIEQNQTVTQSAAAVNIAIASTASQSAEVTQIAAQIAEQTGIEIGDVTQTCEIAIANAQGGEAKAEAGKAEAKAEAPKAEAKASAPAPKAEAKAQLPATGGASLFALGAGALLVTGGLVARRIIK